MNEEQARHLASFLRQQIPSCIAIATREVDYLPSIMIPRHVGTGSPKWIVVANGVIIRNRSEFAP